MSINAVISYLNRERGYDLSAGYYDHVRVWRDWWKGRHEPFHSFKERNGDRIRSRELYTLKMGKKVCEDWASILLNERTQIVIDDGNSQLFVCGDEQVGGVLGDNDFWEHGNALVEKCFGLGTGAFILHFDDLTSSGEAIAPGSDAKIRIDYLPAMQIIPLTIRNKRIVEAAFVSDIMERGKHYIYLEIHELGSDGYRITNRYFEAKNEQLKPIQLPPGVAEYITTGSDIPLFSIFSPNVVNTHDNSNGMGMSIFAQAIDNLKGVDLAFNNFVRDFVLGGKKVFYDASLVKQDEMGNTIAPDDVMQQLFIQFEGAVRETGAPLVHEFNPSLRVSDNVDGVQAQLDYLSFKCGFGTKHYQFNGGTIVTATQYSGDKQELIQNASKHYIIIERALQDIVRAILWAGREILGIPVNPDAQITITFEDSFVIDKESERLRDLQEVRDGLMQKWEYRVKWRGEDEDAAKAMIGSQRSDDGLMGFE